MDHDQRFKTLIQEFFPDFLLLFFANWAARFDLDAPIEWLDKEVFPDPPEGERHILDLVAKLPTREPVPGYAPTALLALIHIEIESPDRTTDLKKRLPRYYIHLRDRYDLPVLPIAIYLKVGLDGIGTDVHLEQFWDLEVLRFSYLYVGLPGLDAVQYLEGENWLGVALSALMRIPKDQVAQLGAEALRRLAGSSLSEQQKFLLGECVQSYLPLDDEQAKALEAILQTGTYAEVRAVNQTVYEKGIEKGIEKGLEKGIEKGIEKGRQEGEALGLRLGIGLALELKFGDAGTQLASQLESVTDLATLRAVQQAIRSANSTDDVRIVLKQA